MDKFEGPTLNGAPYTIFHASHPGALLLGADTPLGPIMQATQAASGGLAFVPVRHLAQGPPVLEYHLGPPLAPLVSFGAPHS